MPNRGPKALFDHERDIFLFYHGGCSVKEIDREFTWGKIQRREVVEALQSLNKPDVDMGCACDICPGSLPHNTTVDRMRRSLFCPVLAGDAQTSRRQSEVIISGCIPVYIGPGFHTLPFADDIDHASFSLFFKVQEVTWTVKEDYQSFNGPRVADTWYLDAKLQPEVIVEVPTLQHIELYLRNLAPAVVAAKQEALAANFHRFTYRPLPGSKLSGPGEIIVDRLCQRAKDIRDKLNRPKPPPPQPRKQAAG